MRKLIVTAAIAAAALASPAFASGTASTSVTADLARNCTLDNVTSAIQLGAVNEAKGGTFQYTCNFIGNPTVTIQSANGAVTTVENGGSSADYGVYVNDRTPADAGYPTPSDWAKASQLTGGGITFGPSNGFLMTGTTPGAQNSPYYYVGLTTPITVAGHYSDVLTFTLNP